MPARLPALRFPAILPACACLTILIASAAEAGPSAQSVPAGPARKGAAAPTKPLRAAPAGEEAAAISRVETEGRSRVEALARRIEALPDGPQKRALQLEGVRIKRETEVQRLTVLADFARRRGDEATAAQAERRIVMILHPERLVAAPSNSAPQRPEKLPMRTQEAGK